MREIKFRAWDIKGRRWINHGQWLGMGDENIEVSASVRTPSILTFGREGVAVQQFTGLKDKNGVEIYEGDVVKHFWNDHIGYVQGEVEFLNGKFVAWCRLNPTSRGSVTLGDLVEVIGNIYENPELLEKEKVELSNTASVGDGMITE
jgi:uncharacterized phage protein (TIGR01671 family)